MLPKKKQAFYSRLGRLRRLVSGSDRLARALVLRVLYLIVCKRFPLLSRRLHYEHKRFNKSEAVEGLVDWLGRMDVLSLAFWLSSLYANLLSKRHRKYHALFFTPPELSARVLVNLKNAGTDFTKATFIDPACGGAAFLAPLAAEIRDALRQQELGAGEILRHLERHLAGWDLDPVLCKLCTAFVWMTMYEEIKETRFLPELAVKCGDALKISRKNARQFDVVVCNPPYRKVPSKELANLSAENRAICAGQPNLYAIFMAVSTRLARIGGRIALITPTSFLSGRYFSPLRKYLAVKTRVHQIDLVEKRQGVFVSVEQETAVTVLERIPKKSVPQAPANVFAIGSLSGAESVGVADIPVDGALWILPRVKTDAALLKLFADCTHTLASYGYETGIGLFVPHRDKRRTRRFRRGDVRAFPLIWSTDVSRSGSLRFERHRHSKRFVVIPQRCDELVNRLPAIALQRTTAKDDARRLVAATVEEEFISRYGGYIGENHVLFLFKTEKAVCDVRLLAQILRCKTVDRIFRCLSGSVAVSTSELAALPLPDPTIVAGALARGEKIESAVNQGYGLERATVNSENTAPARALEEATA